MRAAARVARLRELMAREGLDAMVVRSTSDLAWLTGFERVFDTEQAHTGFVTADRCIIHTDSRYSTAMRDAAGIEGVWEIDDVCVKDGVRLGPADFVSACVAEHGFGSARVAIDADMPLSLYRKLVGLLAQVDFVEREGDVLALRAVKDAEEIEKLKAAQAIADAAFEELLGRIRAGRTEREVSFDLEFAMRRLGADELAFANIVASGPNSANPHAVPGERELVQGDFVVIDFGARLDGYRSDTTRTILIGKPSARQRRMYEAARAANETVEAALKPGVSGRQMHELAEEVLADYGFAGKMGHGLGHGVGIDIHEQPTLSPRYDKPLEAGNVVTVEPGIYLPGQDGIRLEDCGVVTNDGFENFTQLAHALHSVQ